MIKSAQAAGLTASEDAWVRDALKTYAAQRGRAKGIRDAIPGTIEGIASLLGLGGVAKKYIGDPIRDVEMALGGRAIRERIDRNYQPMLRRYARRLSSDDAAALRESLSGTEEGWRTGFELAAGLPLFGKAFGLAGKGLNAAAKGMKYVPLLSKASKGGRAYTLLGKPVAHVTKHGLGYGTAVQVAPYAAAPFVEANENRLAVEDAKRLRDQMQAERDTRRMASWFNPDWAQYAPYAAAAAGGLAGYGAGRALAGNGDGMMASISPWLLAALGAFGSSQLVGSQMER